MHLTPADPSQKCTRATPQRDHRARCLPALVPSLGCGGLVGLTRVVRVGRQPAVPGAVREPACSSVRHPAFRLRSVAVLHAGSERGTIRPETEPGKGRCHAQAGSCRRRWSWRRCSSNGRRGRRWNLRGRRSGESSVHPAAGRCRDPGRTQGDRGRHRQQRRERHRERGDVRGRGDQGRRVDCRRPARRALQGGRHRRRRRFRRQLTGPANKGRLRAVIEDVTHSGLCGHRMWGAARARRAAAHRRWYQDPSKRTASPRSTRSRWGTTVYFGSFADS